MQRIQTYHKNFTCPLNHETEVKVKCQIADWHVLPYTNLHTKYQWLPISSLRNLPKQKTLTCPLYHENEVKASLTEIYTLKLIIWPIIINLASIVAEKSTLL